VDGSSNAKILLALGSQNGHNGGSCQLRGGLNRASEQSHCDVHSGEDDINPDEATLLLFMAARYGLVDAARVAIERGADLRNDSAWADKLMPIHVASAAGHAPVIELLVQHGVSPSVLSGYYGMRPLHFAAMSGRAAAIGSLVKHGAKVNARDTEGTTAVQFAIDARSSESIHALLGAGARRPEEGLSPRSSADEREKTWQSRNVSELESNRSVTFDRENQSVAAKTNRKFRSRVGRSNKGSLKRD
jgi:ankyrin repeat protein